MYRNDHDAALLRIAALERENAELAARVGKPLPPPRPEPPRYVRTPVVLHEVIVAVALGAFMCALTVCSH